MDSRSSSTQTLVLGSSEHWDRWPNTSKTFDAAFDDPAKIHHEIGEAEECHDEKYPDDLKAVVGSFLYSGETKTRTSKFTSRELIENISNVTTEENLRVRAYFVSSSGSNAILSRHFLHLLTQLDAPLALAECWFRELTGGFGSYIQRNEQGSITAIHSWFKQEFAVREKDQDLDMFSGWRLSKIDPNLVKLGITRWDQAVYCHYDVATKRHTVVTEGDSKFHKRLVTFLKTSGDLLVNPMSIPTLLFSTATGLIDKLLPTWFSQDNDRTREVRGSTGSKAMLETLQSDIRFYQKDIQVVNCMERDIVALQALHAQLKEDLGSIISDATFKRIKSVNANTAVQIRRIKYDCEYLCAAAVKNMDLYTSMLSTPNTAQTRNPSFELLHIKKKHTLLAPAALVIVILLPLIALCSVLGLGWFQDTDGSWSASKVFYVVAPIITALAIIGIYAWNKYHQVQDAQHKNQREEIDSGSDSDSDSSSQDTTSIHNLQNESRPNGFFSALMRRRVAVTSPV